MIRKSDIQWWVLEASKHPESAPAIIEELAKRLVELDAENERLCDELSLLRRRAPPTMGSAQVQTLQRKVTTLQNLLQHQVSSGTSVVFLSDRLQSVRIPLSSVSDLARKGHLDLDAQALLELRCTVLVRPGDELLLLTNQGRGLRRPSTDVPTLTGASAWHIAEGQALESGERLTAAVAVGEPPRFWTIATRRGYVQRFVRVALDRKMTEGSRLFKSPFRNDEPVAIVNGDRGDLLLVTRWGKSVRFSQRAIEVQGSIALDLDPDDEIAAALALPADAEILILTASGYAMRRDTAQVGARTRPGGTGKALIQARDVLSVCPYASRAQLLYLTYAGKLVLVPTTNIPLQSRLGKGTHLHDMQRDPAITVTPIPQELG